jgi:hypothetical protein
MNTVLGRKTESLMPSQEDHHSSIQARHTFIPFENASKSSCPATTASINFSEFAIPSFNSSKTISSCTTDLERDFRSFFFSSRSCIFRRFSKVSLSYVHQHHENNDITFVSLQNPTQQAGSMKCQCVYNTYTNPVETLLGLGSSMSVFHTEELLMSSSSSSSRVGSYSLTVNAMSSRCICGPFNQPFNISQLHGITRTASQNGLDMKHTLSRYSLSFSIRTAQALFE